MNTTSIKNKAKLLNLTHLMFTDYNGIYHWGKCIILQNWNPLIIILETHHLNQKQDGMMSNDTQHLSNYKF